jgi:hypothetical protein
MEEKQGRKKCEMRGGLREGGKKDERYGRR